MDFNKTVDLIIKDLEDAREIIDDLRNYPGVPAIQIELAKSKCRNAAEVISLFKEYRKDVSTEPQKVVISGEPLKKEPVKKEPAAKEIAESPKPSSAIIADSFDHLPDSLNETLGTLRGDEEVPEYLKGKPVEKLSQAIGINDRFLFIRELFDGDSDSYNLAITRIDSAKTLTDAKALLMSLAGAKSETDAGRQLLDLVKRKFPGDE